MLKIIGILWICLGFCTAHAQVHLTGSVTDTAGVGLSHATIRFFYEQDTINTLSVDDGSFSANLTKKKYTMDISMKGYYSISIPLKIPFGVGAFKLKSISLKTNYTELDPVIVSQIRPVIIGTDTVNYNAAAFPIRDGSEVEDILKRLPGIEVDVNGNVIVQGKKVGKVTVNGKEFFDGDVLLAIRNLPADIVEKLQVIDDYGDKSRLTGIKSGESTKVLNIVTKQDKRNGEFGHLQAGGGELGKYAADAFANYFKGEHQLSANGSLSNNSPTASNYIHNGGVNYAADQWEPHWGGSLKLTNNGVDSRFSGSTIQDNYYSGGQLRQQQSSETTSKNDNSELASALTYRPDKYSLLRLKTSASLHSVSGQSIGAFSTLQQDGSFTKSTIGSTSNKNQAATQTINSVVYYEKLSSHSRRRFNAQFNFGYTNNRQTTDNQSNDSVISSTGSGISLQHYLTAKSSQAWNLNFTSSYFLPLGAFSFLELGYSGLSSQSEDNLVTRDAGPGVGLPQTVDSLSQDQVFRTFSQRIHGGYIAHMNKIDLTAGLDAQPGWMQSSTNAKGNLTSYHYFSWIPNLQGAYAISRTEKINLAYTGSQNLPGLQQLTPIANLSNPLYPIIGNPNLKPSFTNDLSLHYEHSLLQATQFQGFGLGIGYASTTNTIIPAIMHPKDSGQVIQQTSYINAGVTNTLHVNYRLAFPSLFHKRFRINTDGSLNRNQAPTMTDGRLSNNLNSTWSQGLHFQLLIPDRIEVDLTGSYSVTHTAYPGSVSLPTSFKEAFLSLNAKQYFFRHWILTYRLEQPYISQGRGLQAASASLVASLQYQFLAHNMATVSIAGYNLIGMTAGRMQSSSATITTQTSTQMSGRYFFLNFILKLNRFMK